jgi:hypothetical protein
VPVFPSVDSADEVPGSLSRSAGGPEVLMPVPMVQVGPVVVRVLEGIVPVRV